MSFAPGSRSRRWALTVAIVVVATAVQWALWPLVQPALFLFYFPAVVVAVVFGDGILAGWLSVLIAQWVFAPTVELVALTGQSIRALVFLASCYMINAIRQSRTSAISRLIEGQARLKQSEARTRNVLENAIDAIVGMDSAGLVTQWNAQATVTFGFSVEEAIGQRMSELIVPPEYRADHEAGLRRFLENGHGPILNRRIEITAIRKGGELFPVELTITPIARGKEFEFYAFIRDISERKNYESRLEAAIRGRDEFISIASHELKTPITSLKLQFQLAARRIEVEDPRVFLPEAVRKRVESVNRQLDRMTRLIEDMLDVSRVSTGKLHLDQKRFDFSALTREAVERFMEQMRSVGSTVDVRIEDGIEFFGDEYRADQVISNLLTNAIKYGGGKPVQVELRSRDGKLRFSVKDQGIGIAPEDLGRVFERFERAVGSDNVSGLGLGLYISKQIVEALGGTITLESEVGKGSTFTVELPLAT